MFLTILMPCLNEEKTLKECIVKASVFLKSNNINGEVLIADNGSTDNSIKIAKKYGARVINVENKGYGNALRAGIKEAKGEYIIFGDCDCSYDFLDLKRYVEKFNEGYEFVNGNRFSGKIVHTAMPFSHILGAPVLSFIAKKKFKSNVGDFHCGLRGFKTSIARELNLECEGMEFATEIIAKFSTGKYKMTEIPIVLYKDKRNRPPHLNTIKDGIRHLKFIFK